MRTKTERPWEGKNDPSIEGFRLEPLTDPRFIKPALARFSLDGRPMSWELIEAHDSVAVLIYHRVRESFVLVRQFRPALFLHGADGFSVELCAGIVDKPKSLKQIAAEEVWEECGYEIDPDRLQFVGAFHTSVGFAGSKQTVFYVEVDDTMRRHQGGGVDTERIEVVEVPLSSAKAFVADSNVAKTPGLAFAVYWWFDRFKGGPSPKGRT